MRHWLMKNTRAGVCFFIASLNAILALTGVYKFFYEMPLPAVTRRFDAALWDLVRRWTRHAAACVNFADVAIQPGYFMDDVRFNECDQLGLHPRVLR